MENNKTAVFVVCFVAAMIAIIACAIIFSPSDYVRVTEVEYNAVLADDDSGKVVVTERLTFDIHAAHDSPDGRFWELWRALPEEWENGQRLVSFNVLSVTRLTVDGQPAYLEFDQASRLYWDDSDYVSSSYGLGPNKWFHSQGPYDDYMNFECVMIYVDGLYREQTVFELKYEIIGATVNYQDYSELYMPMYGDSAIKYLNSFSGSISIPLSQMPSANNYHAWSYGTNAHEFKFDEQINGGYNVFSFDLKKEDLQFKRYNQYIEFSLIAFNEDKFKLAQNAPKRYGSDYVSMMADQENYQNLPQKFKSIKIGVFVAFACLGAIIIACVVLVDKKKKRKYKITKPAIDYDFYREIPNELDSNFAGAFVFCKHKFLDDAPGGYAAAMLGLVRKNYIEVEKINASKKWTTENSVINVLNGGSKQLTPTETAYLNLINRYKKDGKLTLSQLQERITSDYEYADTFNKSIRESVKNIGVANGYFSTKNYKKPKYETLKSALIMAIFGAGALFSNVISRLTRLDLAFGAFFVLSAAFFISAAVLAYFARSYVLLTQTGEDEYSKWRGLYRFLNSETLIKERNIEDVAIWEDYLLYATAFGISEKVLKAVKLKFPEFNKNSSLIISHPFLTTHIFMHSFSRSLSRSIRGSSISRALGSISGYSSGGRGGGSGGGGH